jgi:ATP-dependent Clp protease protease subunit
MKNWYSIKALAPEADTTEVTVYDEIGYWGVNAADFARDLKSVTTAKIKLLINSPGGSVIDALAIFNQLRASGKQVDVKVMGIAASAASYLAMAGDHVEMPENTFMWIHNPITGTYGNAEDHRAAASDLDKFGASLTATYARRFKGEEKVLLDLLAAETLLTAAECLEYGLCDEVTPAIEVSAKFEVQERKLPDAVKALFKPKTPEPEPKAASLVDHIVALTKEHGLEEYAPDFLVDARLTNEREAEAAIKNAAQVIKLCKLTGAEDQAKGFVQARAGFDDARKAIAEARAKEADAKPIDTARKSPAVQGTPDPAATINPTDLWAQIAAMQDTQRRSAK